MAEEITKILRLYNYRNKKKEKTTANLSHRKRKWIGVFKNVLF